MKLEDIRKEVDEIDDKILALLARRFSLAKKAGYIKKDSSQSIEDIPRENKIFGRLKHQARQIDLSVPFVEAIFKLIINQSKRIQIK